ncbi:MAG: branched-chain amino acid ABC transporter permease [Alphaproteobacteria bacterium]|nr:branched-chain amino acid ABC transporter permease [Alphaproteobacteria bacterium]
MRLPLPRRAVLAAAVIGFAVLPPAGANPYFIYIANLGLVYVLLAIGLNMLIGYAGQLAFANAALFGIGAYATGLLRVDHGLPFFLAFPAGVAVATAIGVVIALPALRLRGLYLALASIAFAQFCLWAFVHWERVTYGAGGVRLPRLSFAPLPVSVEVGIYYLTLGLVVLMSWLAWNMLRSRVGRALVALRESEVAASALAIDLTRYKAYAFGVSAMFAGVAGGLFSALLGIVTPETFDLYQVVSHFAMVVVGGIGSLWGAIIGAALLVGLQEVLRAFRELQEIAFGALILFTVLFMPSGLIAFIKRFASGWDEPLRRTEGDR